MSKNLLEKIKQGRQYRSMVFECRDSGASDSFVVTGYATTFNEPYELYRMKGMGGNDIILREQVSERAFDSCDMSDVIFQYDHEGRVYARISNNTLKLERDSHGLKITADLGGTASGRALYEEIKGGYTNKMSFGFTVDEDEEKRTQSDDGSTDYLRTITRIGKLYDVSAVSLPANDGTEISARSFLDGVIEKEKEAERLLEDEKRRMTISSEERERTIALLKL